MIAKDDYVIVLDFLPHGKSMDRRAEPLAQAIGEKFFNLLEIVIKEDATIKTKQKIYIGEDKRDYVKYIRSRIGFNDLTSYAKTMVDEVVNDLVTADEKRFVDFFNKAGPITTRLHSLELLPGVGKKHMWQIIEERRKKQFESFSELQKRVQMLPDPKKMIIRRVLEELEGKDRHRIFVASSRI